MKQRNRETTRAHIVARVLHEAMPDLRPAGEPLARAGCWTPAQDAELVRLIASGLSMREVIERMRPMRDISSKSAVTRFWRIVRLYG